MLKTYIFGYIYAYCKSLVNLSSTPSYYVKSPYTFGPLIYDNFIARLFE